MTKFETVWSWALDLINTMVKKGTRTKLLVTIVGVVASWLYADGIISNGGHLAYASAIVIAGIWLIGKYCESQSAVDVELAKQRVFGETNSP